MKIEIKTQGLSSLRAEIAELLRDTRNRRAVSLAGGRGVTAELRRHFTQLDSERPNRRSWPRQHFWREVGRTVANPQPSGGGAVVAINHIAIRQKVEGGPISPVNVSRLTLPAQAEAYGKRARDFPDLRFGCFYDPATGAVRPGLIRSALTNVNSGRKPRRTGAAHAFPERYNRPLFWLVKEVHQAPTPGALPSSEQLQIVAQTAAEQWAQDRLSRTSHSQPPADN